MNKKLSLLLIGILMGPAILAFTHLPAAELPPRPPPSPTNRPATNGRRGRPAEAHHCA